LVSKAYEFKEISLVKQASLADYPNDGTPSYSIIKNILSSFKKYSLVERVPPKHENLGQKRNMTKIQLENLVSDFP
jgi:hypothetical protein